mgnify:CR=1 FL=1
MVTMTCICSLPVAIIFGRGGFPQPTSEWWTIAYTGAFCSVLPFYLGWRMSDAVQAAFSLGGLVLGMVQITTLMFGMTQTLANVVLPQIKRPHLAQRHVVRRAAVPFALQAILLASHQDQHSK